MLRLLVTALMMAASSGDGWSAEAAVPATAPHPLAEQAALYQRIASATFDSRLDLADPEDASKPHRIASAHMAIQGRKFTCAFSEVRAHDVVLFNCQIARNDTHWQYLDATRTLSIKLCTTWRAWGTPDLVPFPCAMPLSPFRALTFAKGSEIEATRLCWTDICSPEWLAACTAASVERTAVLGDGSVVLHCPLGDFELTADHQTVVVQQGAEVRVIVRPYPEFGGRHLIAELQWGTVVDLSDFDQEVITYQAVAADDGSGTYPIPFEDVRSDAVTHAARSRRTITACTINAPIPVGTFDIDPTRATRVIDVSTDFEVPLTQPGDAPSRNH